MHFPSWYYSFQKVMHFINTDNMLNMKSAIMRTLHWVSVPPGVSKNPTHSRYRSYLLKAFLPLPAVGLANCYPKKGESPFPATSSRRRGAAKPRGEELSPAAAHESPWRGGQVPPSPHPAGRTCPPTAAQLRATPRNNPAACPRHSSAFPLPGTGGPRGQGRAVGARTHQQRQQPHRCAGAPRHGRCLLRALLGTGSPPRAAREGKWRRPVEGRTSSRRWVECAGREPSRPRRHGRGQVAPGPPAPPRGGEPRPQPRRAPPAGARRGCSGPRWCRRRCASGGRPPFPLGFQRWIFISPAPPREASWRV